VTPLEPLLVLCFIDKPRISIWLTESLGDNAERIGENNPDGLGPTLDSLKLLFQLNRMWLLPKRYIRQNRIYGRLWCCHMKEKQANKYIVPELAYSAEIAKEFLRILCRVDK